MIDSWRMHFSQLAMPGSRVSLSMTDARPAATHSSESAAAPFLEIPTLGPGSGLGLLSGPGSGLGSGPGSGSGSGPGLGLGSGSGSGLGLGSGSGSGVGLSVGVGLGLGSVSSSQILTGSGGVGRSTVMASQPGGAALGSVLPDNCHMGLRLDSMRVPWSLGLMGYIESLVPRWAVHVKVSGAPPRGVGDW